MAPDETVRNFKLWPVLACWYRGGYWFRVFGHGLSINDRTIHAPLLSERNGRYKMWQKGKWSIKVLKSDPPAMCLQCGKLASTCGCFEAYMSNERFVNAIEAEQNTRMLP